MKNLFWACLLLAVTPSFAQIINPSGSGSTTLNAISNPVAVKAFTMGTNTLNFNMSGNWGSGFGVSISSSGSNAATGPLFQVSSGAATSHDVFQACAQGTSNCAIFTSAGSLTTIGTATIDATKLSGTPKFTTIQDGNGNPFLISSATASAVDSLTVTNAATANPATVTLGASGTDANIHLALNAKGTGTINPNAPILLPAGSASATALQLAAAGLGIYQAASGIGGLASGGNIVGGWNGSRITAVSSAAFAWSSATNNLTTADTCLDRSAAKVIRFDGNSGCSDGLGTAQVGLLTSTNNCSNSGGTCGAAPAGAVTIAAAATTVTVATTAVTANSDITITEDSSMGTRLSVTCNTTTGRTYSVTTKTAGTSFVITASAAPATNPACLSYHIWN